MKKRKGVELWGERAAKREGERGKTEEIDQARPGRGRGGSRTEEQME